jgi:hypothetical protein
VVDDPYRLTTVILWKSARLKLLIEALKRPLPRLVAVLRLLPPACLSFETQLRTAWVNFESKRGHFSQALKKRPLPFDLVACDLVRF